MKKTYKLFMVIVILAAGSLFAQSVFYVAPEAMGDGSGLHRTDAASYTDAGLWADVQNQLNYNSVIVKFLDGSYSKDGLYLLDKGNEENCLILEGESRDGVIFDPNVSTALSLRGVRNTIVRNLTFTGPIKGYGLQVRMGDTGRQTYNVLIENCTFEELGNAYYGAAGTSGEVFNVTFKGCKFQNVGMAGNDYPVHMIYNAYGANHIYIYDCYFENCTRSYVRFRDEVDYGEVVNCTFRSTQSDTEHPFILMPLFNNVNPGDELFATHYLIKGNDFIYDTATQTDSRFAISFMHRGYDPVGWNYLMTAQEGAILESGTAAQKKTLLLNNCGIDGDEVRVIDNFYLNEEMEVAFGSFADYGAVSKGWDDYADITDITSTSFMTFNDIVWGEDFAGINGQLQNAAEWTAIEGGARPFDRANTVYALDTADDGNDPLAYGKSFYSRIGAVYATVPDVNNYVFSGFLWSQGSADVPQRNVDTEIYLETDVDASTHEWMSFDLNANQQTYSHAWRLAIKQNDVNGKILLEIWKYKDDGSTAKLASATVDKPADPQKYHFVFKREGDDVSVAFDEIAYSGTDTDYDASTHDQIVLFRIADNDPNTSEGDYGDSVDSGWGDLVLKNLGVPQDCQEALYRGYDIDGDLNNDCKIDLLDFAVTAEDWLL